MNGFEMMAESYRNLVRQGKLTEEQAKRDIEIYEFLATCSEDDLCRLIDSSAFNDIIRAIVKVSMQNAKIDKQIREKVLNEVRHTFDEMTAKDVLKKAR